jgi:hypothetical protein
MVSGLDWDSGLGTIGTLELGIVWTGVCLEDFVRRIRSEGLDKDSEARLGAGTRGLLGAGWGAGTSGR